MLLIYMKYIIPFSVLIPLITGFTNYKYLSKPFKIIFWFVFVSGVANLINIILGVVYHIPTLILLHIYTIFEFLMLSAFYQYFQNKKGYNIMKWIAVVFTILYFVNFYFQSTSVVNTYTRSLSAVIMIAYGLLFSFKQADTDDEHNWSDNSANWINTGLLIYYSSGLFMFMTSNYFLKASLFVNGIIWSVHDTILLLEYVLFAIGFYKCKTQPTISTY